MSIDNSTKKAMLSRIDQLRKIIEQSERDNVPLHTSTTPHGGVPNAAPILEEIVEIPEETPVPVGEEIGMGCRKFAVLVGIDSYTEQGPNDPKPFGNFGPLTGCVSDVKSVRDMLVSRFGFQKRDIRLVLNDLATKSRILATFAKVAEEAQPGDAVVIVYAGHGTQFIDQIPIDESDFLDEALVPVDYPNGLILDDEVRAVFQKVDADKINLSFLLDSCHSGTGIRADADAFAFRTGSLPTGTSALKKVLISQNKAINVPNPGGPPQLVERHVLLSATKSDQVAREYRNGKVGGVFTSELVKVAQPDMTYQQLLGSIAPEVTRVVKEELDGGVQEPQIEGAYKGRKIFACIPVVQGPI